MKRESGLGPGKIKKKFPLPSLYARPFTAISTCWLVHNLYKIHDGFHSIHMLLPASKSFQDFHKSQEEESANNFTTARWSRGWRNVKTSQIAIIKFAFSFNFIEFFILPQRLLPHFFLLQTPERKLYQRAHKFLCFTSFSVERVERWFFSDKYYSERKILAWSWDWTNNLMIFWSRLVM